MFSYTLFDVSFLYILFDPDFVHSFVSMKLSSLIFAAAAGSAVAAPAHTKRAGALECMISFSFVLLVLLYVMLTAQGWEPTNPEPSLVKTPFPESMYAIHTNDGERG